MKIEYDEDYIKSVILSYEFEKVKTYFKMWRDGDMSTDIFTILLNCVFKDEEKDNA